ncbi:MAG: ABC transporter ATP-binding protein [Trueperaceae bacterium]|nr:MAG: ABC transporter ATP-binding protein [Trueperaceae bacterium]
MTAPKAKPILEVDRLDLGYGELQVVFEVSLEVARGELVGLVGGNGSGKSTVLRAISGMITPWSGEIGFDGLKVNGLKPHQMTRLGMAHVPMGRQLFPNLTVEENLSLGAYLRRARHNRSRNLERVFELFPDLVSKRRQPAGSLSGGQQQMLAIARALMLDPKMLIMDEPSLGLAPFLVKEAMQVVRRVADMGLPILLVEQNVRQVLLVSDRAYVLENGRLVIDGPSVDLMDNPLVKKAYLGL